ncbi:membrane protein [Mesorhizobium sp. L-8-10]|uniref:murein hydrolase activator EnvC family protein n=1 Tax=Mesorhizobium sp. L-8-10 TaxID=2744523 RepID=UPI001926FCCA|nr:murein hydrolase activator EnvC [Mesorhizobium sp. L-8-10]BCH29463.1 membrane protein [Mesorhizobium sp. L-8-10]
MLSKSGAVARLLLLVAALAAPPAFGQEADGAAEMEARQAESQAEYERVSREIALSKERLDRLSAEIADMRKDHASLTAALIQTAKTEKKLSQDVEDITDRLAGLKGQQEEIQLSLSARRDVLAEVLGALQRMGLNPPPALLVKPEDALSSVRSAILLGAVVPELRAETAVLLNDLKELARIAATIEAERDRLSATIGEQVAEQQRLNLLLLEKQTLQQKSEAALDEERQKSERLAAKSRNLQDLIASLEKDIAATRSAEEKARRAEEARKAREATLAALPVPEANRLIETAPFSLMQGKLALPAAGRFSRRFGKGDGNGGVMRGDMLATQSGAIVTAPADGSVLYAGPFRSYGQLLILNAGDGYHVVLAGMGRISVSLGQSVLAGEPVGTMGEARVASAAAFENGNTAPELYIEFRKDGKPVDPAPWWSERLSGRTGNDS